MGWCHKLQHFTICVLFCLISSSTQMRFIIEGRSLLNKEFIGEEEKTMLRAQIGSRPPSCERRCSTCSHCEAIQVPTNPQIKNDNNKVKNSSSSSTLISNIEYSRGDDTTKYKPLSWKCKCGNLIFNP
ncbi:hypothetical protein RJ641_011495 [Dillenia turbinata]|uniref:Epidermal patterning factor-like protein n=1 Tax=Dillenia turbinata TaxID=194707 RepID=A0AAN8Z3B6_9MAGN